MQIQVELNKTILSSKSTVYMTQHFFEQTKKLLEIDSFVNKIAETLLKNINNFPKIIFNDINCYKISIQNLDLVLLFKLGDVEINTTSNDIIFFDILKTKEIIKQNDLRIFNFIRNKNVFNINVDKFKWLSKLKDFKKLYILTNKSGIQLPRMDDYQREIVETVNKNIIVQGVAGSGKTNVCIEKIIFSACRGYKNKILYTTFSRGLLNDTKLKINNYIEELEIFLLSYENDNVVFLDNNHKKALENKLGIFFFSEDDDKIVEKIKNIVNYLKTKVDYFLIQDLYKNITGINQKFVGENYFINDYLKNIKNYQISNILLKINISHETLYKEIFGIISGFCDDKENADLISLTNYKLMRKNNYSEKECGYIYSIGVDYYKHLLENNLIDNNIASRKLLQIINEIPKYAICIIDEVQDYSQITLKLLTSASIKSFCVGDALQMINPTYFSFSYLKDLLFDNMGSKVQSLKYNYRNTKKIAEIMTNLSNINKQTFGVHNFVLTSEAVDDKSKTTAIYVSDDKFIESVKNSSFDNFTFVVNNIKQKEKLKSIIKNQEVLTVSEIKGLERDTVVTYNLLSDNVEKWNELNKILISKKTADENSVYRYYYNLFYVGISRAKQNLFVVENKNISRFNDFFKQNFEKLDSNQAIIQLNQIVSKIEFTQDEILSRVQEFIKLEQFDNARFIANKISDDVLNHQIQIEINVNEQFIQYGNYKQAGIVFWQNGMLNQAKNQFILSGDTELVDLINILNGQENSKLDINIVKYLPDLMDNKIAKDFILSEVIDDINLLKQSFNQIKQNFKGVNNGK